VLTGLGPLRICVGYDRFGETLYYPPEMTEELSSCSPIYEEIDGWSDEISEIASYGDLPKEATAYVERLESLLAVDIGLVSVGPGREQTFRKG
jgi:adenylosuccinate synthase